VNKTLCLQGSHWQWMGIGLMFLVIISIPLNAFSQMTEIVQTQNKPSVMLNDLERNLKKAGLKGCIISHGSTDDDKGYLEVNCSLTAFHVGGFCDVALGNQTLNDMNNSAQKILTELLSASPVGKILDFEVDVVGWSDGLDFEESSTLSNFKCGNYDDQIDMWLQGSDISLHRRLGLYRGYLIWSKLMRITDRLSMPLETPTLNKAVLGSSPGRVLLKSKHSTQIGPKYRKVDIHFKIYPKLFMRCAGANRPVLVNGVRVCLPVCPSGSHLREVGGGLSCIPDCKPDERLDFQEGKGFQCKHNKCTNNTNGCSKSGLRTALAIFIDQAATQLNAYPSRLLAGIIVHGRVLDVYTLLGAVIDGKDRSWGLTALGGIRFPVGKTKNWYPRIDISFSNLSKHWSNRQWTPQWLISADLGFDWEFIRKEHYNIALALSVPLGISVADVYYAKGAAINSKVRIKFLVGGRLGLRFMF